MIRSKEMKNNRENEFHTGDFWLMLYGAVMFIVIFYASR